MSSNSPPLGTQWNQWRSEKNKVFSLTRQIQTIIWWKCLFVHSVCTNDFDDEKSKIVSDPFRLNLSCLTFSVIFNSKEGEEFIGFGVRQYLPSASGLTRIDKDLDNTCLRMTSRLRSSRTLRILPASKLSWKIILHGKHCNCNFSASPYRLFLCLILVPIFRTKILPLEHIWSVMCVNLAQK